MTDRPQSVFNAATVRTAIAGSLVKLDPRKMVHNPVMFVVEVGAAFTTVGFLIQAFGGEPLGGGDEPAWFTGVVALWLWLTVDLRQPRRGPGRGPRQGPGRRAARDAHRDRRPAARRLHGPGNRARSVATSSWSRRAR